MSCRAAAFLMALWTLPLSAPATQAAAVAYAPANITVAQLFERNRHAAGAFEAGAYRMVTRTVSPGGDVWETTSLWSGGDYRTTVEEGGFVRRYGEYRGRQWHQNPNGLVLPSSDFFQDVDPFVVALSRPQAQAGGVRLLGVTGNSSPKLVVEVTPGNGLTERRYYDERTYLLDRLEMTDYDGHQQVWQYDDYRSVSGRTMPHAIAYEQDGSSVTLETTLSSCERVAPSSLDLTIAQSRPLFDLGDRDSVVIPARFTDNGIIVTVSIGGRGLDFILDSGSSELLIDPEVASDLGMNSTGAMRVSFAGDFTLANARAPDFTVGGLTARNVAFSTAAFEEDLPGQRVVGLLGTDFIASGALKIDFEKKSLTLLRSVPADLGSSGWSALPLRMDYGVPLVKAAFGGLPGYFVADLGADYSTLYPHYFSQFPNNIPRGTPDQEEMVTLGGKPFGIKHITMKRLVLGDWVFGDVQVVVPSAQDAQDRDYDGLIGRDTLSSFDLIFDYANDRLWFRPIDVGK
ncbi:MAG: pepsin/retropepsin-like aspartic protease family protein [Candidatus Cybelea sp.]